MTTHLDPIYAALAGPLATGFWRFTNAYCSPSRIHVVHGTNYETFHLNLLDCYLYRAASRANVIIGDAKLLPKYMDATCSKEHYRHNDTFLLWVLWVGSNLMILPVARPVCTRVTNLPMDPIHHQIE